MPDVESEHAGRSTRVVDRREDGSQKAHRRPFAQTFPPPLGRLHATGGKAVREMRKYWNGGSARSEAWEEECGELPVQPAEIGRNDE